MRLMFPVAAKEDARKYLQLGTANQQGNSSYIAVSNCVSRLRELVRHRPDVTAGSDRHMLLWGLNRCSAEETRVQYVQQLDDTHGSCSIQWLAQQADNFMRRVR